MNTKLNRGILLLLTLLVFDGPVTVNQQVGTPTHVPAEDPGNDVLATFDDLSRNVLDSLVAVLLLGERPGIESPFLANNYAIIRIFDSMDGDSRTITASRRAPRSHRGSAHLPDEVDQVAGLNSRARFAPPARGSVRTGCHRENPRRSPLEQKSS